MHILALALSYVLVHGSPNSIISSGVSIETAVAKRDAYGHDFLWFRTRGNAYVIRDQAMIERIDQLFDPAHAFDPEFERIQTELRPLERRETELDRQIDALTDRDDGPPLTADEEQRLDSLRNEMDALRPKLHRLEQQEEDIDRKRDAAEAEAERRMLPVLDEAIRSGVAQPAR